MLIIAWLLLTECLLNARHLDNKCFMSIVPLDIFFNNPVKWVSVTFPILQMRKLRITETK